MSRTEDAVQQLVVGRRRPKLEKTGLHGSDMICAFLEKYFAKLTEVDFHGFMATPWLRFVEASQDRMA